MIRKHIYLPLLASVFAFAAYAFAANPGPEHELSSEYLADTYTRDVSQWAGEGRISMATDNFNLDREIIYFFRSGEVIFNSEYHFGQRSSANDFIMVTRQPDGLEHLVINGQKVKSGKGIFVYYADPTNLSKAAYAFEEGDDRYLAIPGQVLGPYSSFDWPEFAPGDISKVRFEYRRMGMHFFHDYDGTITRVPDRFETHNPDVTYHSPNGKHSARFDLDNRRIEFNGRMHTFPDYFSSASANRIDIYDCGVAEISVNLKYDDGKSAYKYFAVSPKGIFELVRGMRVDPVSGKIVDSVADSMEESVFYNTQRTLEYEQVGEEWKAGATFALQDKTKKHEFLSNWKYDYVLIDNVKFGDYAPIAANYDSERHAFVWYTIEEDKLIRNVYRL